MRILYIAFASSAHTLKWINHFKKDHEVMLISFYPSEFITGIDFRYLPLKNKNLAILKLPAVKKLIKEFKPDILHAHYATSCGLLATLSGFHPYVLSTWGDDIFKFPHKSFFHKWLVKKAILGADYVTATSRMLAEGTKRIAKKNLEIEVIPFGVDLKHYYSIKRPLRDSVTIGTVRNLTPKYGLEFLIKATAKIITEGRSVRLIIVGDGPIRGELEALAAGLGIGNKVEFAGFVPNEKVVGYLNKFDIFVIPSIGEGETFGVAAVEAMATGLPVIASNIGGLPEVVENDRTGLYTIPGDVESIANALRKYIDSEELRIMHGLAGRARVEEYFNWNDNAVKMELLYRQAVRDKEYL